jgi:hypothetical protein
MRTKIVLGLATATLFCGAPVMASTTLYSDGFESWNQGQLATTDASTANPGLPNGPDNPWWAPYTGNEWVYGAVDPVSPHSGNQMLVGYAPGDFDQDSINLAHRFGGDAPIPGNLTLDFWFYDTNGAGDNHNTGYAEIGYYDAIPNNTDYDPSTATHGLTFTSKIQRIVLGMVGNNGGDLNYYQARVIGGTPDVGTGYAGTYVNTTTPRTVGWHEGRIVIGPQLSTGGNDVSFYIDDMNTPDAHVVTTEDYGYNVLVMDAQMAGTGPNLASTLNYFDDITLTSTLTSPHNPGDTNNDGVVDLTDLNNVLNNFGSTGTGNPGDDNSDHVVDLSDLNAVLNNFGTTYTSLSAVPEPATLSLLALGATSLLARRRRSR